MNQFNYDRGCGSLSFDNHGCGCCKKKVRSIIQPHSMHISDVSRRRRRRRRSASLKMRMRMQLRRYLNPYPRRQRYLPRYLRRRFENKLMLLLNNFKSELYIMTVVCLYIFRVTLSGNQIEENSIQLNIKQYQQLLYYVFVYSLFLWKCELL